MLLIICTSDHTGMITRICDRHEYLHVSFLILKLIIMIIIINYDSYDAQLIVQYQHADHDDYYHQDHLDHHDQEEDDYHDLDQVCSPQYDTQCKTVQDEKCEIR